MNSQYEVVNTEVANVTKPLAASKLKKTAVVCVEYDGQQVQFMPDGWFNATVAAAKYGKDPYEWQRLPATIKYLAAFERKYGKIPYLKSKRGQGGGTWLHPKLAVRFAQWLDEDFAVWCDDQIDGLLRGDHPHFEHRRLRHAAASSNKYLRSMIERVREADGKETKAHHYINECTLVNYIVCGEFVGLDRDAMPMPVLDFLADAEGYNAMLFARGKSREDRIKMLAKFKRDWIAKRGELPALVLAEQPKLEARTISKGLTGAAKPRKLKAALDDTAARSPEHALKACADYAANAPRALDVREAAERAADYR